VGRLYLFLHGLTVIAERKGTPGTPDTFEIALPTVPGHVYKAGDWLAETTIENGNTLELGGVTPGTASIYNTGFLVDVPKLYPVTTNKRAATLFVDRPNEVLGLLLARKSGRLKATPANPATAFQDLAEVLVLVYDFSDENQVLLKNHYWQPSATGGAISLHVIATSEVMEGKQHEDDTQQALQAVFQTPFPGIEYNPGPPKPLVASWVDPKHSDFGDLNDRRGGANTRRQHHGEYVIEQNNLLAFARAELEHPASRAQRLNRLGRMYREKRRIEGLWHRPDPLDGADMSSCGSMSGN